MRLLLSIFALTNILISLIIHFFGMSIPYVNLHTGKLQFLFLLLALLSFGLTHPLWKKISFLASFFGLVLFNVFRLKFWHAWAVPLFVLFPYEIFSMIFYFRNKILEDIILLYKEKFSYFLAFAVSLLVIFVYFPIFSLYFEGDEWYRFRTYIPAMQKFPLLISGVLQTIRAPADYGFHQSYVVNALYPIFFFLFGLHPERYLLLSVILHISTSTAIGLLAYKVSSKKEIGLCTAISFSVLASHSQAVTWIDAVLNTQLSVLFGVTSLIYLHAYCIKRNTRLVVIAMVLCLLAMWSKETALTFVAASVLLYLLFAKIKKISDLLYVFAVLGVFGISRVLPSFFIESKSPIQLLTTLADPVQRGLFFFRIWAFPLKIFSQVMIPQERLIDMSVWLADMQFPFFLTEKLIRGSTYVQFIQTVVPEMLSYSFSILFICTSFLLSSKKNRILLLSLAGLYVFACIPIVLITLIFPWWGTVSLIDSRHLYHLSWIVLLMLITAFFDFTDSFRRHGKFIFISLMFLFVAFQVVQLRLKFESSFQTGKDRKMITSRIIDSVRSPKDTLVIYTTSNKSYYGFAEYMLPFQTSFAHMIPILFSNKLNANGIEYPERFYSPSFFKRGGLVAQGYETQDGKSIGYYLDKKMLQKAVVEHDINPEVIYSYRFDGDTHELEDISGAVREQIARFVDSRKNVKDWKTYELTEDRLRFSFDPKWRVERKSKDIFIYDDLQSEPVFQIEIFEPKGKTHSQFALEHGPIEKMRTHVRDFDFDTERIEYYFEDKLDRRIFLLAGNNKKFYIVRSRENANVDQFLKTFEFWDDSNDEYLFIQK